MMLPHMIIGYHHPEGDVGQAFLNGACSSGFAAAVESFCHGDVLLFAALMVHELGHNLGIQHDHSACLCNNKGFCLMHENITRESGFSNCRSDYFCQFLQEQKGACLFNKLQHKGRSRRHSHCGDGMVEVQEQCDCGSACKNHQCCDNTCRLKGDAECGDVLCCFNCRLKPRGFTCRAAVGECDLPEYCDGHSGECLTDRYKQDGTLCDVIHCCVGGWCKNPNNQCAAIYGDPARSVPEDCYVSMNSKGNRFGNCGRHRSANAPYVKCVDENIFCGKLICTNIRQIPPIKPQHTLLQVTHKDDWCWSMDAYNTTDIPDDADVHTVYVNHSCTDHAVLKYNCIPAESCNGKGVCNNLRHCHCEAGYVPPDYRNPEDGGSLDSGPPGKPFDQSLRAEGSDRPVKCTNETENPGKIIFILPSFLIVLLIILICSISLSAGIETVKTPGGSSEESSEITESET
ncbi:hypothetical protein MC885_000886 [Smutsia gigantea]|nr:hypothetical protein MC885_000886 [Smutsia gigantea]